MSDQPQIGDTILARHGQSVVVLVVERVDPHRVYLKSACLKYRYDCAHSRYHDLRQETDAIRRSEAAQQRRDDMRSYTECC